MTDFELDKVVKLAGTNYDRRRKLTTNSVANIQKAYNHGKGKSISSLAAQYGVAPGTILYHVNKMYRDAHNKKRKLYAASFLDSTAQRISRVAYKRSILANKV